MAKDFAEIEDAERKLPSLEMLRRIIPFVRPYLASFVVAFALGLVSVAMVLAQPIVLRAVIDEDFVNGDREGLIRHGFIYLGLLLGSSVASAFSSILLGRSGVRAVNAIKQVVFERFLALGLPWVEKHPVGNLVSRVESDSQRPISLCSTLAMRMLSPIVMIAGAVVVICTTDWRLFVIAVIFVPIMVGSTLIMFATMRPRFRKERRLYADLTGQVAELVPAVRLLQALGRRDWAAARLAAANRVYLRYTSGLFYLEYGFWNAVGFVQILLTCVGLALGVGWVEEKTMTTGTLVMFAQYAAMIYWPVLALSEQLAEIQRAGGAADRIFSALDMELPITAPASPRPVPDGQDLELRDVSFAYEEDRPVLRDVSFRIPAGRTVALVGATGSGKTTIINLLMRFRDVGAGSVTLGGIDIRGFDPFEYRRRFGLVLQDLYLFPAPVRENLRAFRDGIPDAQVDEAAGLAGIRETLERRPDGLDATLAEGGSDLSYGERQLLAFARALAIDPEFLILDEATSSVDPGTELKIQQTLARLTRGRTWLIVAHRLSTIRRADEILVLDRGEIVERGHHDALIARDGLYARLVRLQQVGEVGDAGAAGSGGRA